MSSKVSELFLHLATCVQFVLYLKTLFQGLLNLARISSRQFSFESFLLISAYMFWTGGTGTGNWGRKNWGCWWKFGLKAGTPSLICIFIIWFGDCCIWAGTGLTFRISLQVAIISPVEPNVTCWVALPIEGGNVLCWSYMFIRLGDSSHSVSVERAAPTCTPPRTRDFHTFCRAFGRTSVTSWLRYVATGGWTLISLM